MMLVLQLHLLNHQAIVVVNKEMRILQVLYQLKVLVSRHYHMTQVLFYLKVVMLHTVEQTSVGQVHQDMKVIILQPVVSTAAMLIQLLLHFMLQI
jgi:hypothetical protein